MTVTSNSLITINGTNYESSQLSPQGQRLLALLNEAQKELHGLEIRKELLIASQQHILEQLKPLLKEPVSNEKSGFDSSVGRPSDTTSNTPLTKQAAQDEAVLRQKGGTVPILGRASETIPTTPVTKPTEQPTPFPANIPESFRAEG